MKKQDAGLYEEIKNECLEITNHINFLTERIKKLRAMKVPNCFVYPIEIVEADIKLENLTDMLTGWTEDDEDCIRSAINRLTPDPITGLVPCGCGEWIYTIEKGSCMDYHVTAKCSECGWDWFSKDGVGNFSAVFSAFITNGDSKRDEVERFLIENAKANNKLNYCPNCGAKMEDKT